MKFSCIGSNPQAVRLLKEIAASQHSLQACLLSGPLLQLTVESALPVEIAASEEDILHSGSVDVVIIAVDDPEDCLRLSRAAAQAERHVVVLPPCPASPALAFELHLIFDESRHAVAPVMSRWNLSAISTPAMPLVLDVNRTQQLALQIECPRSDETQVASGVGSRSLRHWMEYGLDLLSATGLPYAQVTSLDSRGADGTLLSRLVTLSASPTAERLLPPATLTIRNVSRDAAAPPLFQVIDQQGHAEILAVDPQRALLPSIESLCADRVHCTAVLESLATTLELADAADKSLRRRRTVDVHFDTGSERGVFKSQMTAIGCGVLTWMMFGLVAYLVFASLGEWPNWVLQTARAVWIAPLIVFLLAQFLLPLARERSSTR